MSRRTMHWTLAAGTAALALGALAQQQAAADPELVNFPADYRTKFVMYNTVDRPDGKAVRFFYANPDAVKAAQPATDLPNGTVLVLEFRKAKVDDKGEIVYAADGRMIPTDEITGVFVQEKRTGWGTAYAPGIRNGEWECAAFTKERARNATITTYEPCFKCHTTRPHRDFNYTFNKWVIDGKP